MQSQDIYATVKGKVPGTPPLTPKPRPRREKPHPPSSASTDAAVCPPPLPPKPPAKPAETQNQEEDIYVDIESVDSTEAVYTDIRSVLAEERGSFSLSEFASRFGQLLPLCVSVEKGYEGEVERDSIAMGDTYNIHFVKHSKMVVLTDSSNETYNIPLNSPVQFAPLFQDSNSNSADDTKELVFDRVSDIIAHKPLPRLLRATKCQMKDDRVVVEKNEILVVQKVITSTLRKKTLQVYSVSQSKEKILPNDCVGGFTADPYATRLHLPDITSLFQNEFPLRVQMYLTDIEFSDGSDFPFHLASEILQLTSVLTETSLVASTHWGDGQTDPDDQYLIDIPIGLNIEVSLYRADKKDDVNQKDLFQRTQKLYKMFHTAKIRSIRVSSCDLGMAARKGHEGEGVQLDEPNMIYEDVQRVPQLLTVPRQVVPPPIMPRRKDSRPGRETNEIRCLEPGGRKEHMYQNLSQSADKESSEDVYVTMAPSPSKSPLKTGGKRRQATPSGGSVAPTREQICEDDTSIIMQLMARVKKLEEQVGLLNDKVETLTRQS